MRRREFLVVLVDDASCAIHQPGRTEFRVGTPDPELAVAEWRRIRGWRYRFMNGYRISSRIYVYEVEEDTSVARR